jgi:SAM-dependent methyltransferase
MTTKNHWENVFTDKTDNQKSWFEDYPHTSIKFIFDAGLPKDAAIIDVGGDDSKLVDALLNGSYTNVTVLDISAKAIERAKERLGNKASKVHWIVSDITDFEPPVQFDFWHDRAAFHFLTTEEKIYKYVSTAEDAIKRAGYLILGTFSKNGPIKCSGLAIKQYSEASILARFEIAFDRIKCIQEDHITPFKTIQNFLFWSFKRKQLLF